MRNKARFTILYLKTLLLTALLLVSGIAQGQTTMPPTGPQPDVYVLGTCIPDNSGGGGGGGGTPASTKFFVNYPVQPDSVYWFFEANPQDPNDSLESREFQPVHTFSGQGSYPVNLYAFYDLDNDGEADTVKTDIPVTIKPSNAQLQIKEDGKDEPVSEVVLCFPNDTKTLNAEVTSGSGGSGGGSPGGGGQNITWYRPQSADEATTSGASITINTDTTANGKYKHAGTYIVVHDDPNGCPIYQTFNVVIYNQTDQNSSRWYFGENAGIDWKTRTAIPDTLSADWNAPEGVALTGDANADVLFFTDGETLWFRNDLTQVETGIGGSLDVTQNSLFVDYPSDERLFYLFTINNAGQLSYSILDQATVSPGVSRADGGVGSGGAPLAQQPIKAIPLYQEPVTEKLTSTGRTDGGVWIVTHELGTNAFVSIPVSAEGIGKPVRSEIGDPHLDGTGYLRFADGGKVLASTYNSGSGNEINLHKFNADSGIVSEPTVTLEVENGTLYGLAFADSMMYATVYDDINQKSYLYQFKVDSTLDETKIKQSEVKIEVDEVLGAVEVGPDGVLYIARATPGKNDKLFTIPNPTDSLVSSFNLENSTFDLAPGTFSTLGLPNFGENAGSAPTEASVSATSICESPDNAVEKVEVSAVQRYSNDQTIRFTLYNSDSVAIAGPFDQTAAGQGTPTNYTFEQDLPIGNYYVQIQIANECSPPDVFDYPANGKKITASFTVSGIPEAKLLTPDELEICNSSTATFIGEAFINNQPVDPASVNFIWMEGDAVVSTKNELTVDKAGAWELMVSSGAGCFSDPIPVSAIDLRPQASLGDDIGVCVGDPLPKNTIGVDNRLNDFTVKWWVNKGNGFDSLSETSSELSIADIDTRFPGRYQYAVRLTSKSGNNCFKDDTLTIRVNALPVVEIVPSNNNCSGTAELEAFTQGTTGEVKYQWFKTDGTPVGQSAKKIIIRESGSYFVEITDNGSTCSAVSDPYTIDLQDPLKDLKINAEPGCGEAGVNELTAKTSYSGNDINFEWQRKEGNQFVTIPGLTGETVTPEDGIYRVIASIQNTMCSSGKDTSEVITVSQTIPPAIQRVYVVCPNIEEMSRDTISLEGYESYEWRNSTGQVVSRESEFIVTQEGNYELMVNECSETVPFKVVYDCTPVLWLPNAIRFNSPVNGNGTFKILNPKMAENVKDFQIVILNRWGEVLFQSTDPLFEWKGTDRNGKPVMVNTYVYVITYRNMFGEDSSYKNQRGGITVLK